MRGFLTGIIFCVVVGVAGALAYSFSGMADIAAAAPENPAVAWFLHNTFLHSLDRAAATVIEPPNLETPERVAAGAKLYNTECVYCHGSPGDDPTALAKGLNPPAPTLLTANRNNTPNVIFWVAKNGVKMTAMPAWGKSYDDEHLWSVAAFLHQKRGLSADDYKALTAD